MPPRTSLLALFVAVVAALAALPAAASATVYCVDTTPAELADNGAIDASCETPAETLSLAVAAAAASGAEADTILIGPGDYTLPANPGSNEVYYFSASPANTVVIRGIGDPHLTMGGTAGMQSGIYLSAPAGTAIEGLRLTIPANADVGSDAGILLGGGAVARDVTVDGPAATNAQGIRLYGTAKVLESTVDLPVEASPTNSGVGSTSSGVVAIVDSKVRATTGVVTSGGEVTVERGTIEAKVGTSTDSGTLVLRDSLVVLSPMYGAIGVNLGNSNAGSAAIHGVVQGATIVGGGSNSAGIRVQADNGGEAADAVVSSSLIWGPLYPLQVWADNGREAKVEAAYSNYGANLSLKENLDNSGEAGVLVYTPSEVTDLEPGFVDAAAGDFHLAPGSPLADLGDPAAPPAEELDIDGEARAVAAGCPSAAGRRDVGADEIVPVCVEPEAEGEGAGAGSGSGSGSGAAGGPTPGATPVPPDTSVAGKSRVATAKGRARVVLRLRATEAGASFRCKVDRGAYRPCGARFAVVLRLGRHRIAVRAVGAGGADPTPAVKVVKIVAGRLAQGPAGKAG